MSSVTNNIFFISSEIKNIRARWALSYIMSHLPKNCQFSEDSNRGDTDTKVSQTNRFLYCFRIETATAVPTNS